MYAFTAWTNGLMTVTGDGRLHGPFGGYTSPGNRVTVDLSAAQHVGHTFLRVQLEYYAVDTWDTEQGMCAGWVLQASF